MKTSFLKFIVLALLFSPLQSFAQQAEFGVFWGKYKSFASEQQHSNIVGDFDKLVGTNHINDGGGIQAAWYFTESLGLRAGFRFNTAKYDLDVYKPIQPYFGHNFFFNLTDKFQQIPVGITWRKPVFNNTRTLKVYSDISLDIHRFNAAFEKIEFKFFEEAATVKSAKNIIAVDFHDMGKKHYKLGGTFGIGITPFNCEQLELNFLYAHSFSSFKVISYQSDLSYFTKEDEEVKFPSYGTLNIKPGSFSAQLVFYFYQK